MHPHVRRLSEAAAVAAAMAVTVGMVPAGAAPAPATAVPLPTDGTTDVSAPALSSTGRYVAHLAVQRGAVAPPQQVRRTDLRTGTSELLNPSIDGGVASGNYSRPPTISADGSRIAFTSTASRLVPGDTNGRNDAFVRDAATDTTILASVGLGGRPADGDTGMAALSRNGRYVVFTSDATNLVVGSTTTNSDVFLRDLATRTTVAVSVRPDGSPSRGPGATTADVSADGRFVAFASYDTDLVTTDDDDTDSDLYLRNLATGRTRWISAGVPAGANPSGVVISPDAQWVSSRWDDGSLHLTQASTGVTTTVATNGYAVLGSFSSDLGRFVYVSAGQPFVRNLLTGTSVPIPIPAGGFVTTVTVSGNGRLAAFDWTPTSGTATRIFRVAL